MEEIWKPIAGYEGLYEVSNHGRVKSLRQSKVMKMFTNGRYLRIILTKDKHETAHSVHRLVATAFCSPKEGCVVDHINGNRFDNRAENLHWVSQKENVKRAYDMKIAKAWNGKPVIRLDDGRVFESTKDCAEKIGGRGSSIWRVCVGERTTYKKQRFMYLEDFQNEQQK